MFMNSMTIKKYVGMQGVSGSLSVAVRWASKKAGGSSRNCLKKPAGKRLGLKCGDGES